LQKEEFAMRMLRRIGLALAGPLAALALLVPVAPVAAAAPVGTCTATLTIFTTSPGTVQQAGPIQVFTNSGVGGRYTAGFLAGYTISGAQDIVLDTSTNQSVLTGQFVASGSGGTLTVRYVGRADLNTRLATGQFVASNGTGTFKDFVWEGTINAQLVSMSPPTFTATDTGPCYPPR
jgi:hypothetical protein